MREFFEKRVLSGNINIKMDDAKGVWRGNKEEIINAIISIAKEYDRGGYILTLRQLYYQLVSRDIVPNHDKVYAKISSIKDDVVYNGLVDWNVFEDRGRVPSIAYFEDSIEGALERTSKWYELDKQLEQKNHVEVWTEKDAISSILKRVTDKYTIRLVVNKGYTSSTAVYGAYTRFVECIKEGKKVVILYFGDHDPSGLDMIRDIKERLTFMFVNGSQLDEIVEEWWEKEEKSYYDFMHLEGFENIGELFQSDLDNSDLMRLFERGQKALFLAENDFFNVVPVGLTMEQIKQYKPPHNPAKITDPRAKKYVEKYGAVSWEVDALSPPIMTEIVNNAILENIDIDILNNIKEREKEEKQKIIALINKLQ